MIFLIYITDCWHSYASQKLIAIAFDWSQVIEFCEKHHFNETDESLTSDDIFNIENIGQTQSSEIDRDFEYNITVIEADEMTDYIEL